MALNKIKAMVKQEIGLDEVSIGSSLVDSKIKLRMQMIGVESANAYADFLAASKNEMQQLVEELVISETWFFRDHAPFDAMIQFLSQQWKKRGQGSKVHVLSVPCSTGEEPYSISMAFLNAGYDAARYSVDAVDVSRRVIEKAKKGLYTKNSFRGRKDIIEKHFTAEGEFYLLDQAVKESVSFSVGNLIDDGFSAGHPLYDVIFCRNLLIYFDRETQKKAYEKLYRLLSEDGVIFFGHAEIGGALSEYFESISYPFAFAYRKKRTKLSKANFTLPAKSRETRKKPLKKIVQTVASSSKASSVAGGILAGSPAYSAKDSLSIEQIRILANRGELELAKKACDEYLKNHSVSGDVYCLLGVIDEAKGDYKKAREHFTRAVYLSPDNYEALIYLSLQAERDGDMDLASKYRQRADRVKKRTSDKNTPGGEAWEV